MYHVRTFCCHRWHCIFFSFSLPYRDANLFCGAQKNHFFHHHSFFVVVSFFVHKILIETFHIQMVSRCLNIWHVGTSPRHSDGFSCKYHRQAQYCTYDDDLSLYVWTILTSTPAWIVLHVSFFKFNKITHLYTVVSFENPQKFAPVPLSNGILRWYHEYFHLSKLLDLIQNMKLFQTYSVPIEF